MQVTTLGELFSHPAFIAILTTIIIVIGNILVGVSMLPADIRKRRYKIHRYVYFACIGAFVLFIYVSSKYESPTVFNYSVLAYFLSAVPFSRKLNVTLHAIISSVGLVLLVVVAALSF